MKNTKCGDFSKGNNIMETTNLTTNFDKKKRKEEDNRCEIMEQRVTPWKCLNLTIENSPRTTNKVQRIERNCHP